MAAASYGAYQPGAVDPWSIETQLAKEATTSPAMAQMMLGNYQQERRAQGNVYGEEAAKQHDFAKQQLVAQMTEARNKLIPEIIGKPGGGEFLAGGGIQGIGPGDGGNASAWAGLGQAGHQYDFAKNLAEEGKGVESFSRAGQDLALQQIPGLQNFQTTGAGQHSDITVEQMKSNTALQLAAAKAARGAKAEKDPKVHYNFYGDPTPSGQPNNATVSLPANTPAESVQRYRDTISRNLGIANPSATNVPGTTPEGGGGSPRSTPPPAAREAVPGLRPAPAPTSQAAPSGKTVYNTTPQVQAEAKAAYERLPAAAKVQVWANKPGNVMPVVTPDKGNAYFVGKDGNRYDVPLPGGR
jgi:hypothetical protein